MRKSTIVKWVVVVFAGLAIAWLFLHPRKHHPVKLGDRAPNFTLPRFPSGNLMLRDFRGKVVLLNFWATWCPPCVVETPSLEALASKMENRNVVVIGVSVDEDPTALKTFLARNHITYPIARDPSRNIPTSYGTLKFPETYIIDRDGYVADKIIGATDWTDPRMIQYVEDLARRGSKSSQSSKSGW